MSEKLKPCPFCGGEVFCQCGVLDNFMHYVVGCGHCRIKVYFSPFSYPTAKQVIEAWNRRYDHE